MSWLKGCEICNTGLINRVDELVRKGKISLNKACKLMEKEGKKKIGTLVYSAEAIRGRYRLREPNPEVGHNDQPTVDISDKKQEVTVAPKSKVGNQPDETQAETEVMPEATELSAEHHIEVAKASAKANKPQKSELEKAAATIKLAARTLERIVEGDIKDNGTDEDRLFAESIKRYGPSVIISFYQLGLDPEKAIIFYKGGDENVKKAIVESNL